MEISDTIHLLGDLLGQVLVDQESRQLFDLEERIRQAAKDRRLPDPAKSQNGVRALQAEIKALDGVNAGIIARAFVLYFDLVNTVEDLSRISALRKEALSKSPAPG